MKWVFWISALFIGYSYAGYAVWLWVRSKLSPWPVQRGPVDASVTVLMVVKNEESTLAEKLENLLHLQYPSDRWGLVVVSDGSSDRTEEILRGYGDHPRVRVLLNPLSSGKAAGLNDAIACAEGEIVVFTDARQKIESEAILRLAENFADKAVGCASGELMLGNSNTGETRQGMGLYWRIEKIVRELESASGSVVGATGALYAARRALVVRLPAQTILDDVFIPMHIVKQGFRVVFEPRAAAWDAPNLGGEREFRRKVRTLSGNYQLLQLCPWILDGSDPLRFEFISHKLCRLLVPFALLTLLISSLWLKPALYRTALSLQLGFYGLALLGYFRANLGSVSKASDAALTFVTLNAAAWFAFLNFATGKKTVWNA